MIGVYMTEKAIIDVEFDYGTPPISGHIQGLSCILIAVEMEEEEEARH